MTAAWIAQALKVGLLIWLGLLMAIVIGRVLCGKIPTRGVLARNPQNAGRETSAPRAISALVFPLVILFLVLEAMKFDPGVLGPDGWPMFPDISDNFLLLLTGGNGLYLADKMRMFQTGVVTK
ncbi:MAG: hypothetical protein FJX62_18590 [Alphaproteobacteria bacterium]|nr:hypothetical protein [Alphaproteobacteria bacterium]